MGSRGNAVMDKLNSGIGGARKRVAALVEISRWTWVVNMAVLIVAAVYGYYALVALAAFTGVLSLVAAAIARRVSLYLGEAEDLISSEVLGPGRAA